MKNTIKLYTDGSCNGHIGGYAVILAGLEDEIPKSYNHLVDSGSKTNTTNNEMELFGIQAAVEFAKEITEDKIIVFSDSEYAIKSCTIWYKNWQKNGWKTSSKKPVKNQELIKKIIRILEENPQIELQHVKGHDGNKWNEFADEMANQARHSVLNKDKIQWREIRKTVDDCFDCNPVSHIFKINNGYVIDITLPYSYPDGLTSIDFNLCPVFRELKSIGFKYISISNVYRAQEGNEPEDECEHIELFVKRDF